MLTSLVAFQLPRRRSVAPLKPFRRVSPEDTPAERLERILLKVNAEIREQIAYRDTVAEAIDELRGQARRPPRRKIHSA